MVVLLVFLGVGVFAYLWWRWRMTTLTRDCRWREDRTAGGWRCAYCGATQTEAAEPRHCLRHTI